MKSLDSTVNKWISRKLFVFLIASVALFTGVLESSDWVIIATAYIAVQSFVDSVEKLFKAKNNNGTAE
jgi:hypothetical protein